MDTPYGRVTRRFVVSIRGFAAAAGLTVCLLASASPASARTEFQGWDSAQMFKMIIDVEIDPGTGAVKIDGGRIESRGATGFYLPIQQAQGKQAPKPAKNQMAGVVAFSQTAGTASFTLFTGTLTGTLTNGTLTANGVRFEAYNQVHDDNFVMVNGNGGASSSASNSSGNSGGGNTGSLVGIPNAGSPTGLAPIPVNLHPVGLTSAKPMPEPTLVATPAKTTAVTPVNTGGGKTAPTVVLLDNSNPGGVSQMAGTKRPSFLLRTPATVTEVWTYHWNNGRGQAPGTISIIGSNGVTYGPWPAQGSSGQGGAPNVNWTVHPNVILPAGAYTVADSSPGTWSENTTSHECGFTRVSGHE